MPYRFKYSENLYYARCSIKEKRTETEKILRTLCEWKKIKIVETEVRTDYIHMLTKMPVLNFTGLLERKEQINAQ